MKNFVKMETITLQKNIIALFASLAFVACIVACTTNKEVIMDPEETENSVIPELDGSSSNILQSSTKVNHIVPVTFKNTSTMKDISVRSDKPITFVMGEDVRVINAGGEFSGEFTSNYISFLPVEEGAVLLSITLTDGHQNAYSFGVNITSKFNTTPEASLDNSTTEVEEGLIQIGTRAQDADEQIGDRIGTYEWVLTSTTLPTQKIYTETSTLLMNKSDGYDKIMVNVYDNDGAVFSTPFVALK